MTHIYRLTVYDHRQLGGPMHLPAQTPVIAADNFSTAVKAKAQFAKIFQKNQPYGYRMPTPKIGKWYDFASFGMRITKERVW